MNHIPLAAFIPVGFLYFIALYHILRTDHALNLTARYFMWTMKIYGFEGEIHPTPRAKMICKVANTLLVVGLSVYLFVILPKLLH